MKISLAMIVKNEEINIIRCIESVKDLVDEIVIVDTGSTDNTIKIVKQYPNIMVYDFAWCNDFSKARNFAIEKTTCDYILVLDADEYIVEGTRNELDKLMSKKCIGRLLISSNFKKDNLEYYSNEYVSRLFPKEIRYVGAIHEQLDSHVTRVKVNFKIKHSGYYGINKGERNIPLLIQEVSKNPGNPYYLFQLGKELRINKQYEEAYGYLQKAYKIVTECAYYGELVIELINSGKELDKKEILGIIRENENRLKNVSDFHFAKGLYFMDYSLNHAHEAQDYINKIKGSFLTCLSLKDVEHVEYVQGTSSFMALYNLGVYYEVTGNKIKAIKYYKLSSDYGYHLAKNRLNCL